MGQEPAQPTPQYPQLPSGFLSTLTKAILTVVQRLKEQLFLFVIGYGILIVLAFLISWALKTFTPLYATIGALVVLALVTLTFDMITTSMKIRSRLFSETGFKIWHRGNKRGEPRKMDKSASEAHRECLENHIQETLDLINQYEETLRLSDDPKEKARCAKHLNELRRYLEEYQCELTAVQSRPCSPAPRGAVKDERRPGSEVSAETCDRASLRRQLIAALKTLHVLEEKVAAYPILDTPPTLELNLEEQRRRVTDLQTKLQNLSEESDERT